MPTGLTHDGHPATSTRVEILPLTGLRAVAAIAVVVHHIGMPPSAPGWLRELANAGFIGVPLFFMLSGFVLAYNYPTLNLRDPRSVLRFWVARLARVMPLYWAVLTLTVLSRGVRGIDQDGSLPLHYLALQTWSGDVSVGSAIYNGPGWSICVELFLYAMFPVLVLLVAHVARHHGTRGLLALAGLAFAVQLALWALFVAKGWADLPAVDPQSAHRWLYRNPLTRVPEFLVGMTLAFIVGSGVTLSLFWARLSQAAVLVAVPVVCALRDHDNGPLGAAFFGVLWTIPFGLLIFSLASDRGFFARLLATPAMVTLGTASFALYLTHRSRLPGFGQGSVDSAPGVWAYVAVLLVLVWCLFLAEGAHRYIEVPARTYVLRWYDRLVPRSSRKQDPAG